MNKKKITLLILTFMLCFFASNLTMNTNAIATSLDNELIQRQNSYTLTYDLNGGKGVIDPVNVQEETEIILPGAKQVTKSGYKFLGWSTQKGGAEVEYKVEDKIVIKENTTLYAVWGKGYTVKFNANGGKSSKKSIKVYKGLKYGKLPTPTRKGYTFTGWYTAKSGGSKVTNDTTFNTNGNKTLYARWTLTKYKITYKLAGGKNASNPATYKMNTTVSLKKPSKTGYTFAGWYSDSKCKNKVTQIKKGSTGNKTLYAKWTANKYSITFNGNGSTSGTTKKMKACKYNTSYALTGNGFKKKGYSFNGWNTKKDGKGTKYTNKESIKNLAIKNNANVTLYAQWKKTKYTISYELNGGKNNSANPAQYYYTTSTINFKNPSKTGYTFGGWYTNSKYKTKITQIKKGSTGNKKIYAKWNQIKYTIKYNLNGGKNNSANPVQYYYTTSTITLKNPTRTGYTFDGWYTDSDCTNPITEVTENSTGNKSVYAKWIANQYNVTFNGNGAVSGEMDDITEVKYGANIMLPYSNYIGEESDYDFVGWNTKPDGTGTTYKEGATVKNLTAINNGTVTLYAKWGVEVPTFVGIENIKYDKVGIEFNKTKSADGYIIYRSKSANKGYSEITTIEIDKNSYLESIYDTKYYSDSSLSPSTTYYYKLRAYKINASGNKVYSEYTSARKHKTAAKPNFAMQVDPNRRMKGKYSYYAIVNVKNKGNKPLYVGGSNTFDALIRPYSNAIKEYGYIAETSVKSKKTKDLYFKMNDHRYFSSGATVTFFFTYDGCRYTVAVNDAGYWMYQ